jgi:uncharacterized membrane protein YfcA
MHLTGWQILWGILGALCVGLSKGGISGLGIVAAPLFALVFPPMESTGLVLVILISADLVSVTIFRRHAVWAHIVRLFPFAATGVVGGYFVCRLLLQYPDHARSQKLFGVMMGGILLGLVGLHLWRKQKTSGQEEKAAELVPQNWWMIVAVGVLAGFTTMVANAAGPVMILYLLAMRLPKMEFMGTAAWYFLTLNLFKVPFSYDLGLINVHSLQVDAFFAPFAMASVVVGRWALKFINQELFEKLAIGFTVLAALKLLSGM